MAALACAEHMRDAVSNVADKADDKKMPNQEKGACPSPAKRRPTPGDDAKPKLVPLADDPEKTVRVGANLNPK